MASVPAKTAHKPPIKINALIARFIVAHIVKEAKQRMSLPDRTESWFAGRAASGHSSVALDNKDRFIVNSIFLTNLPKTIIPF